MKPRYLAVFITIAMTCSPVRATTVAQDRLLLAIRQVESGGKLHPEDGDNHQAIGPLQIHRACWRDSRITGTYQDCRSWPYSRRVFEGYAMRYEPQAWRRGDVGLLSRLWNAGPNWRDHPHSSGRYAAKVEAAMEKMK